LRAGNRPCACRQRHQRPDTAGTIVLAVPARNLREHRRRGLDDLPIPPVVDGAICRTDFVTVSPDGKDTYPATVQLTAIPRDGGTYCANGMWRTKDGTGSGTTSLKVFIQDGVVRRAP
jgi:hypothetical protein